MINTVCVCGAGTMGSGIAQVCAQSGFTTILFDTNELVLDKARLNIEQTLQRLRDKEKISAEEKEETFKRIKFLNNLSYCKADLVIEAIIENTEAKVALFKQLSEINNIEVIFATNTSSLSVSEIQENILHPERVVGMHFFNPAPVMKLVEVIKGDLTGEQVAQTICTFCRQMNKAPVMCKDAPGFIVNRIARQYYLEALRLVEAGFASAETVDAVMEASGFKMGPFRLMDLIGIDINLSVTQSMYEAFNAAERFRPSAIQIEKVNNDELGRKSGKGFYKYT